MIPESGTTIDDPTVPKGKGDGYATSTINSTDLFLAFFGGALSGADAGVGFFFAFYGYIIGFADSHLGFRVFQNLN